jgi:hypothetical protein
MASVKCLLKLPGVKARAKFATEEFLKRSKAYWDSKSAKKSKQDKEGRSTEKSDAPAPKNEGNSSTLGQNAPQTDNLADSPHIGGHTDAKRSS